MEEYELKSILNYDEPELIAGDIDDMKKKDMANIRMVWKVCSEFESVWATVAPGKEK